ncbi:MAG: ATP-binding cassette domain-containing protein [Candidatus Nealsonbacteria bacterium]|nr:ATP-binding cassette domain-containing protein [Candidatus Nealsonbacteria bacterium]
MREILLKIDKLKVKGSGKEILKGVNLQIKRGEIQTLLGPNASGKSTLAQVILGNPKYKITQGRIFFEGKEITKFFPEKRAKLGIAMTWQSPPAIKGVKFSQLLARISTFGGSTSREVAKGVEPNLLEREINVDFSGGEKKMSELVQVIALNPKLVIFDEIDSGLDIKRLEKAAKIIKKELVDKKVSILLITHSGAILNFLKPDITNVMVQGRIICREKDYKKVLKIIKKYGYEKCKKCKLLAG